MTSEPPFRWRSIAAPVLLPGLLFAIGEGAILPIIPVFANNLGATLAVAGLIAGVLMVGELVGNIPSGWLVARVGERAAMIGAALVSVLGLTLCLLSSGPWMLGVGVALVGLATAVFALARHAFVTSYVPLYYRARALSTLGGVFRLGFFVGPFLTAGAIHLFGTVASAFWIHIVACLAAAAVLLFGREPSAVFATAAAARTSTAHPGHTSSDASNGLFATIYRMRRVLLTLGAGASILSALRSSRTVILPLWAVSIGIGETDIALIIGIAGGIDFALFYASGQVMDRFGRLWSALPCILGLAAGHLMLALTHDVPGRVTWFIAAAALLSLANGIGSGILMTLGADHADPRNPAPFLGAWRFTSGVGGALAPLLIAGVTAAASLALAAGGIAALGLLGAGLLLRYVPNRAVR